MSWSNWVKNNRYTLYRTAVIQEQFIECIMDHTPKSGTILEAGIGMATTLELLRDLQYEVSGFDIDPLVVEEAKNRFPTLSDGLYIADMLNSEAYSTKVDTIIHQGVLEHFSDKDIKKILSLQVQNTKHIVFDVPNNWRKDLSNEGAWQRWESPQFWESILDDMGLKYERYGRTYDYGDQFIPSILKKYNSDLMKRVGRSSIFVVEGNASF